MDIDTLMTKWRCKYCSSHVSCCICTPVNKHRNMWGESSFLLQTNALIFCQRTELELELVQLRAKVSSGRSILQHPLCLLINPITYSHKINLWFTMSRLCLNNLQLKWNMQSQNIVHITEDMSIFCFRQSCMHGASYDWQQSRYRGLIWLPLPEIYCQVLYATNFNLLIKHFTLQVS